MTGWPDRIEAVAWEETPEGGDNLAAADALVAQLPYAGSSRFATGPRVRRLSDGKLGRLLSIAARPEPAAVVRGLIAQGIPPEIHAARVIARDAEATQAAWLASLGLERLPPEW